MPFWGGHAGGVGWNYVHGEVAQTDWETYLGHLDSFATGGHEHLSLFLISRRSETPNAAMRRQLAAFMQEHEPLLLRVRANAMVFDSALARGALTAVNWLFRKPFPERVFGDSAQALAWLKEMDPAIEPDLVRRDFERVVPAERLIF